MFIGPHCAAPYQYWNLVAAEARTVDMRAVRVLLECFLLVELICNATAKLEILAFLYCGEFVKNSIAVRHGSIVISYS